MSYSYYEKKTKKVIFALSFNITLSYADIVARTFNVILLHVNLLRS